MLGVEEDGNNKLYVKNGLADARKSKDTFWKLVNNRQKISHNVILNQGVYIIQVDNKDILVIEVPRAERTVRSTNGQEPDAEALRKFYDDVEFQDESDKSDNKQALNQKTSDKPDDKPTTNQRTSDKSDDKQALNQKTSDKSDDKQAIILDFLSTHRFATTKQLSELLQLSMPRTRVYLDVLVKSQKITSHGANKNRTYSLKEETRK